MTAAEFIGRITSETKTMKTISKLTLAALSAAFLTTAASADELILVPVHGTFLFRSVKQPTTIALYGYGKSGIGRAASNNAERSELRRTPVSTPHGPVIFYEPAK
jgi:hypothetical protein